MKLKLNLQITKNLNYLPKTKLFYKWITKIIKTKIELTLKIITAKEIKYLNKKYRKISKETNILTFQYKRSYLNKIILGDIIISPKVIYNEALNFKVEKNIHWCYIIIHGILHLLNYTHKTNIDNKIMKKLEKQIIISIIKNKKPLTKYLKL